MKKSKLIEQIEDIIKTYEYGKEKNTEFSKGRLDAFKTLLPLVKKLTIPNVSQQRELLVAFMKWQQNQWLSVNSENVDNTVDTYLSN